MSHAATVLVLSLALSPLVTAQGTRDADERELQAYCLTMPKLRQLTQVYAAMSRIAKQDPKLQQYGS